MTVLEDRQLHRVRYWQGQMLRSADFNAQHADDAQHRWWHNRALHDAYGIYQGLGVSGVTQGEGPLTAVIVDAGVAYDCFGREMILDAAQTVPLPVFSMDASGAFSLLISYAESGRRSTPAACITATQEVQRSASFIWKNSDRVVLTDGVSLARLEVARGGGRRLSPRLVLPASRALARPPIGNGATLPSTTKWAPWNVDVGAHLVFRSMTSDQTVGVQARVDTTDAGFTETPCYTAWLSGNLLDASGVPTTGYLFTSIDEESATGFTFRMWTPVDPPVLEVARRTSFARLLPQTPQDMQAFVNFAKRQQLSIHWLGVQKSETTAPFVPLQNRASKRLLLPLLLNRSAATGKDV